MNATEDNEEFRWCTAEFQKWMRRYYSTVPLHRRRAKVLPPGVDRYRDPRAAERWRAWQACWNYLRSPPRSAL